MADEVKWQGDVYVRPLGRGICLLQEGRDGYLDDLLGEEGYYRVEVTARRLTPEEQAVAEKKP